MKILHLLYSSLPDVTGSSIRSHQILKYQKSKGLEVYPITSPFQPPHKSGAMEEEIDGITYYRTFLSGDYGFLDSKKSFRKRINKILPFFTFYNRAKLIAMKYDVDIIHGHTSFFSGLTGLFLAKSLKKPFVYEIRSNWIQGMVENSAFSRRSFISSIYSFLENIVIKYASEIVIIGENLKPYVIKSGRKNIEKCLIVRNSVDLEEIERSYITTSRKNIKRSGIVFGFIGTIYNYEGLDDLIKAFKELKLKYPESQLSIVGGGESLESLKILANEIGLDVEFIGKVTREAVPQYYQIIDVIVLPRKSLEVTNQVTPLKPLEAMGYRKAILASDVQGIKEIVIDGINGVLFQAGSIEDLYKKMEFFVLNPASVESIGQASYNWVKENRSWEKEINKYIDLYKRIK